MKIRRFCSGLLAAVLLLALMALPAGAAAASTVSTEEAIQVINALGIMVGDESGEFHLNRRVTRAEFITMAVNATGTGDQVGEASTSPYPDVPRTHWAAGYVQAGVQAGLISGYLDGTFRPSNQIPCICFITCSPPTPRRAPPILTSWATHSTPPVRWTGWPWSTA